MSVPADELYLRWLIDLVATPNEINRYLEVSKILYSEPYVPVHIMDENRAIDGIELRQEWLSLYDEHAYIYDGWLEEPCSVLEMLVALSRRANFTATSMTTAEWFKTMLDNLSLRIPDVNFQENKHKVYYILDLMDHGEISPFPTNYPDYKDQLWDQMMEYIDVNKINNYI